MKHFIPNAQTNTRLRINPNVIPAGKHRRTNTFGYHLGDPNRVTATNNDIEDRGGPDKYTKFTTV